jgi:hypothetical protein
MTLSTGEKRDGCHKNETKLKQTKKPDKIGHHFACMIRGHRTPVYRHSFIYILEQ